MSGTRDTRAASWKRTAKKARRLMEWLRELDVEVTEPPNFDTPPHLRGQLGEK